MRRPFGRWFIRRHATEDGTEVLHDLTPSEWEVEDPTEPWMLYARVPVEAAAEAIRQRPTPFEFTGPGWRITGVVTEMSWSGGPNATVTLRAESATSDIGTEAPFWPPRDLIDRSGGDLPE